MLKEDHQPADHGPQNGLDEEGFKTLSHESLTLMAALSNEYLE